MPIALLDDLDEHLVAAAEDLLDRRLDQPASRAPRLAAAGVAPPRTGLDRPAQAHLALQLVDLLDLLADLLFEFRVDLFLDGRSWRVVEEVFVVGVDLVESRRGRSVVVEVVGGASLRRANAGAGSRKPLGVVELGVEHLGLAAGLRLGLGTVALAASATAATAAFRLGLGGAGFGLALVVVPGEVAGVEFGERVEAAVVGLLVRVRPGRRRIPARRLAAARGAGRSPARRRGCAAEVDRPRARSVGRGFQGRFGGANSVGAVGAAG